MGVTQDDQRHVTSGDELVEPPQSALHHEAIQQFASHFH